MSKLMTAFVIALVFPAAGALAQPVVGPDALGIVEAPAAGSVELDLGDVPEIVKHSAMVAFKAYAGKASLTGASIDLDDVQAVYEIAGETEDGRLLEADVTADGTVKELEIEIAAKHVPAAVLEAIELYLPGFEASDERPMVEKSVRPTATGLSEVWYEFAGTAYDVEVRSDGRALLVEPA